MNTGMRVAVAAIAGSTVVAAVSGAVALASTSSARTTQAAASAHVAGPASSQYSAGFTWHALHLRNGWRALDVGTYRAPSYAVRDGVLYLSGILVAPHPTMAPEFAVLPVGARPAHDMWMIYYNFGGGGTNLIGNMEIEPDGGMFAYSNGGPTLDPSLQAISFPLSS